MNVRQFGGTYRLIELYNTTSVTVPSTANGAAGNVAVTLPTGSQCALGDIVEFSSQTAIPAGVVISAGVTATGVITFSIYNGSGSTYNPGALNYNIIIKRPETF
jgi:hypothetical protein